MTFKAHVRNGRLFLDEPTDRPDGTEVVLEEVRDEFWDSLSDEERAELSAAIEESEEDIKAGRVRDAFEVINDLRRRRT
jgi:hypothetical protein